MALVDSSKVLYTSLSGWLGGSMLMGRLLWMMAKSQERLSIGAPSQAFGGAADERSPDGATLC
jgi:hypothetical protein